MEYVVYSVDSAHKKLSTFKPICSNHHKSPQLYSKTFTLYSKPVKNMGQMCCEPFYLLWLVVFLCKTKIALSDSSSFHTLSFIPYSLHCIHTSIFWALLVMKSASYSTEVSKPTDSEWMASSSPPLLRSNPKVKCMLWYLSEWVWAISLSKCSQGEWTYQKAPVLTRNI